MLYICYYYHDYIYYYSAATIRFQALFVASDPVYSKMFTAVQYIHTRYLIDPRLLILSYCCWIPIRC